MLEVLLSGAAGGVVILLLDVVFRWLAVWRNRAEERKSLLRHLSAVVYFNSYRLKGIAESSGISTMVNNVSILRNDNWDTCKLRLAQLLTTDPNHMKTLTVYYAHLNSTTTEVLFEGLSEEEKANTVADAARKALEMGRTVRMFGQKYLKDPYFTEGLVKNTLGD